MTADHACPICGDARHLTSSGAVFTCATCGAAHVYPPQGQTQPVRAPIPADVLDAALSASPGSILDARCGDGAHLAAAHARGWKCFGVEPDPNLRAAAKQKLPGAFIVESIGDVIPHHFDVVLLPDVLSHEPSPYPVLYQLFSIGAVVPTTKVVITTSAGAVRFTPRALEYLLKRLHFTSCDIRETAGGLVATATGSAFTEFMRERYVPGTWSKLAEYEHLPRYALAKTLAADKTVLDFGCGTGYGAALMAEVAAQVTGLDIDATALAWATQSHHNPRLAFRRHDDLGASLPDKSFDLITCFEMIEHVDHATQKAVVSNMARLLRDDGMLVISTPNPDVTALYGANPYHIREMNEAEFRELLGPHFPHIKILRQYVRVGVAIDQETGDGALTPGDLGDGAGAKPLAFLAVCSRAALPALPNRVLFDQCVDFIAQFMAKEDNLNRTRLTAYQHGEEAHSLRGQLDRTVGDLRHSLAERTRVEKILEDTRTQLTAQLHATTHELDTLRRVREAELRSPRFLARQLASATKTRLKSIAGNWAAVLKTGIQEPQMWGGPHTDESANAENQRALAPAGGYACALVIPTKNGGPLFKRVVEGLQKQTHWNEVEFIVVDSGSTDDTVAIARAAGAKILTVPPSEFNHGATRDYAVSQAGHNRIILTVQDATPHDEHMIERLLAALDQENVAGVYARQIPYPDADVITKRNLHMHLTGRSKRHVTAIQDQDAYAALSPMQKYALCNFDNVCAAIRKDVWEQEKFGRVNFGEDIDWGQRVLKRGLKIVYEPAAAVIHSHDRPMSYEYKRNYICHRKLYSLFGVEVTPSIATVLQGWLHWTVRDVIYIARAEHRWPVKVEQILKAPALNFLKVLGQYQAVRDEKAGTTRTVSGV